MKKLLFSAVSLDIGGIETALVTLLNHLAKQKENEKYKYEITLVLEHKQGLFLDDIDRNIKILEYAPSKNKVVIFRKMLNLFKQIRFKLKYGNKFDFSASYATYSNPGAFVARIASKNSALWCHMDYMEMFENNETKVRNFFEEKRYKDFKHIIFVSDEGRKSFIKIFPEETEKTLCIYNLIDYEKIVKMSEKSVNDFTTKENVITFINIGRHDEKQKRLTRIIDAVEHLKGNTKQNFRVIFIGDGPDIEKYQKIIEDKKLENEIILLGRKKNPYPYLKMADCVILTSDYEGYPVVFVESMTLNKPIITTKVSGTESIEKEGYGLIMDKNAESIADAMQNFITNGFEIKEKFDSEKYNCKIIEKLEEIIEN